MKKIAILGSTGSIGTQTVDILPSIDAEVVALTTNRRINLLEEQARALHPKMVCAMDENAAKALKIKLADTDIEVLTGMDGLIACAAESGADIVVTAVVGMVGLLPTMAAIKAGKDIALANKETLVCAGALMNFLVGFLIVLAVMQPNGPNGGYIVSTIASVDPASTAAGDLKAGDEILKIDGYHILVRSDFETALSRTASTTHKVTVRREGEKVTLPSVKLEATVTDANGNKRIGITFAELPDSLGMHLSMSVRTAVNYARLVWSSMGMLVSGQVGVDQLAGPVGMAEVMADTAKYSMISFFQLVAFISINLGVMNLLPLPALDGGRLVFLIIEGIRRKPVPPKYEGYVHAAGLMLLLMLMVYVTGQDVLRIFMRSN